MRMWPRFALLVVVVSEWNFALSASAATPAEFEELLAQALELDEAPPANRDAKAVAAAYRRAADAGDGFAHLRLGQLYETGTGVPHDYASARRHYEAAVAAGVQEARLRLAICHLEGWGGPVDRVAFVRAVQTAAEAGYVPAQRILGMIYAAGIGVAENRAEGVRWLERAAAADDADAQYSLGQSAERVRRLTQASDKALARKWYELSAEQDYTTSMRAMARTLLTGDRTTRDWALGQQWLRLAAESGDVEALYTLAILEVLHVDSPQRDLEQARAWLRESSQHGNSNATEVLELEARGRSLADAMRYVLSTPFEDRYVEKVAVQTKDSAPSGTRQPQVYRVVRPIYPESLRLSGIQGQVTMQFVVDVAGRVVDAEVVEATHPVLGERALEAVRQWRFHPGQVDGRVVNTRMRAPVYFNLNPEAMDGVEGLLGYARDRTQRLGGEAAEHGMDLRLAKPQGRLPRPMQADGQPLPPDARGVLLLVLDAEGAVTRGFVLNAEPEESGPPVLAAASTQRFAPRTSDGTPVPGAVVLPYNFGPRPERVLQSP